MIAADTLLGKIPDRLIALRHEVSLSSVWLIRHHLKIPASHQRLIGKYRTKLNMDIVVPLMGKEKDIRIAERYGVSRERIRQIRKKLGIMKYKIIRKN